jgi:hypothetical protein
MTIDLFVSKHGDAWRLYVAGWVPPRLRNRLDSYGECFPLPELPFDELERFMWTNDALAVLSVASGTLAPDAPTSRTSL